jgi:TolB-like protein/DNA-binding winged helix-turn-helix (wHTH) protein/Tfp pilus assembly protein PilF
MTARDLKNGERTDNSATLGKMGDEKLQLFSDYVLDTARGCLLHAGRPVHLRPQAYRALKFLAENRGRLITKDQLIEEVWEGRAVTDDSLVQCLRDVRHALGDNTAQILRTERGRGYIFDPIDDSQTTAWTEQVDVIRVVVEDDEAKQLARDKIEPPQSADVLTSDSAIAPAPTKLFPSPATSASTPATRTRYLTASLIALASIAAVVVGILIFRRVTARGAPVTSVAVLPFVNASGDAQLDYVSDGLSESLIDRLSQIPGLKVIARSSSFKYKGEQVDPREVAKALGVETVVVGRVVQRGQDLEVRAELVDAPEGTQIWGEQYSRRADDIQTMQEQIARAITEKLRLRLSGEQEQRLTRRATANSRAYQFYLNGLFYLRKRGPKDLTKALDYFNQAVAIDPGFAVAWAGLAQTHLIFARNGLLEPKEANAKAKAAAEQALKSDDTLADAHLAMAVLKQHEWDWAGADRDFRRAIELNPNDVSAHDEYTEYLSCMERHGEALAENKRAQELDPLQSSLRRREAWTLHLARRSKEALQLMQQSIKLEPPTLGAHDQLAWIYEGNGMYAEAVAERQKAIDIIGETTGGLCYLGGALAGAGRKAEAQAILEKLKTTKDYVSPEELAGFYAMLGDKESAFAQLERAYAAHDLQLQVLKVDFRLDSLRSDARFQDLVRRVGLPQ